MKIEVHAETAGEGFSAQIDDEPLIFSGTTQAGDATADITPGEHHLFFFTFGPPQAEYTVAITAPPEARFTAMHQISPSMKAARLFTFHVNANSATANDASDSDGGEL